MKLVLGGNVSGQQRNEVRNTRAPRIAPKAQFRAYGGAIFGVKPIRQLPRRFNS